MCFWVASSRLFRWVRVFVAWSIVFIVGCFYMVHFKTTLTKKDFSSDYNKLENSSEISLMVQEPSPNRFDIAQGIGIIVFPDRYADDLGNYNDTTSGGNQVVSDGRREKISLDLNNESNIHETTPSSSNPFQDVMLETVTSKNGQSSLIKEKASFPSYEDIVARYLSSVGPNLNQSSQAALPAHYKRWNVDWTIRHRGLFPESLYSSPQEEFPKQRFPKAILIGAGKCGTRALIEFLSMNPYIVRANQEVHFFDRKQNLDKGLGWYLEQMPLSYSNQMTVEKSPSYMWSYAALKEIYLMDKNMKLLVMVKDPVQRVVSQAIRNDQEVFTDAFMEKTSRGDYRMKRQSNTVQWSIYVKYLRWWMDAFSAKQIHVVEAKELAANPAQEIQHVERFLGVPSMIQGSNFYFNETKGFHCMRPLYQKEEILCLSEGKGRVHPKLPPWLEKLMYDFFRPHNEQLFSLLGRRFAWSPESS